ncbi:SRPBCC family protein [Paenibacillus sp. NPDC055715]
MPRIQNSIKINASPEHVYEITNNINRWTELFEDYKISSIVSKEDCGRFTKMVFQLGYSEKNTWTSWRILDREQLVAIAERIDPLFPFAYMHLKWTYDHILEGTLMTWIQDFEMDPDYSETISVVLNRMGDHTRHNQERIKYMIESNLLKS